MAGGMWRLQTTPEYERDAKHYGKKHPHESRAVHNNLATVLEALNSGVPLLQIKTGFWSSEGKGVYRISERGFGKNLKATRLYVCPFEQDKVLYLLAIGDKNRQGQDIVDCQRRAARIVEHFRQNTARGQDNDESEQAI